MKFNFTAKNGGMDFGKNQDSFYQFLQNNEGKRFQISKLQTQRSKSQNSYYWAYLRIIEDDTGNLSSDLHEYFKRKLLPPIEVIIKGRKGARSFKRPKSTKELDKAEFGEYLDKICALVEIPLPDPAEIYDNGSVLEAQKKEINYPEYIGEPEF